MLTSKKDKAPVSQTRNKRMLEEAFDIALYDEVKARKERTILFTTYLKRRKKNKISFL